jgi:4-hydroxybenzoate polyprenyltransferase
MGICADALSRRGRRTTHRADSIKEALGWLKVVFVALVAVDVSLIGWLAQNLRTAQTAFVLLAFFAVVCASGALIGVSYAAYRCIGRLEMLH